MSRCKSCDEVLTKSEGAWIEHLKQHEDMCTKCITIVRDAEAEHNVCELQEDGSDITELITFDDE